MITLLGLEAVPGLPFMPSRSLDVVTPHRSLVRRAGARSGPRQISPGGYPSTPVAPSCPAGPSDPPGVAQSAPDPPGNDGHQPGVGSQVRGDPDLEAGVQRTGARGGRGQVAPDMPTQIEEVGHEED